MPTSRLLVPIRASLLAAALAVAPAVPLHARDAAAADATTDARSPASRALHAFFDGEWERGLRDSPENASYAGDDRYNDRWTDYSLEAIAAREAADREALATLRAIDRAALSPATGTRRS